MHREFLKNLKVGDQPLPKEVIDMIMAENGRDIEAAKKANTGVDGGAEGGKMFTQEDVNRIVSERLAKEREKIQNNGSKDTEQLQAEVARLQGELTAQAEAHKKQLADVVFDHQLDTAIKEARGRNASAIRAMLDLDALKGSEDQGAAIKNALWRPFRKETAGHSTAARSLRLTLPIPAHPPQGLRALPMPSSLLKCEELILIGYRISNQIPAPY